MDATEEKERQKMRSVMKRLTDRISHIEQQIEKLRALEAEISTKHNYFAPEEVEVVQSRLTGLVAEKDSVVAELKDKRDLYETTIQKLEEALDVRTAVIENGNSRAILDSDSELMDVFVGRHSEIIKRLQEARMQLYSVP